MAPALHKGAAPPGLESLRLSPNTSVLGYHLPRLRRSGLRFARLFSLSPLLLSLSQLL